MTRGSLMIVNCIASSIACAESGSEQPKVSDA